MDFMRVLQILNRRKWLIFLSALAAVGLTFVTTRITGARWTAKVRFSSADQSADPMGGKGGTPLPYYEELVKSSDVLLPALKQSGYPKLGPEELGEITNHIQFRSTGVSSFQLWVSDSNPVRAGKLANTLADGFIERNRSVYTERLQKSIDLFKDQLRRLDQEISKSLKAYNNYRYGTQGGQIAGGGTYIGSQSSPILSQLVTARQRRSELSERLLLAQNLLHQRERDLSQVSRTIAHPRSPEQDPLVQQLKAQLASEESRLTALRARYTDDKMEVRQVKATRDAFADRLARERQRLSKVVVQEPNPNYGRTVEAIHEIKEEINSLQIEIGMLDAGIKDREDKVRKAGAASGYLATLATEIQQRVSARTSLSARMQALEMSLDVADRQVPIIITDRVSELNPPINTKDPKKLLVLAGLCAMLGTAGLIVALDSQDRRLKTVGDADLALPVPVCAAIPQPLGPVTANALARVTEFHPQSLHSEAYHFLGLRLLNVHGQRIKSLMALTAKVEQGSTSTITNLGITLAQAGQRVILVDANVRTPQMHGVFGFTNDFGLMDLLQHPDDDAFARAMRPTSVPNLHVITSGSAASNPWELFRSPQLLEVARHLEDLADYVLYDTPSALVFTDALNLTPIIDAAILYVRAFENLNGAEQRLVDFLKDSHVVVLGSVLSDVPAPLLESYSDYQRIYAPTVRPLRAFTEGEGPVLAVAGDVRSAAPNPPANAENGNGMGNGMS